MKQEQALEQALEQKQLTVEKLKEPARVEVVKIEDEKFFAYEKQKAHN